MKKQIQALKDKNTQEVVDLPRGKKCYWIKMGIQNKILS